ncbi:MAG: hypothetical protein JJU28_03060 [Cyclobacteriaceae bacterium]|nr:hypothetical protein [Cyclobacteriaceae bacterium]
MEEHSDPRKIFEIRKGNFENAYNRYQRLYKRIASLRFSLFVLFLTVLIYAISVKSSGLISVVIPVYTLIFLILIKWHRKISFQAARNRKLFHLNEEELKKLHGELNSFDGMGRYADDKHHYSKDLDILGDHSIFQLLNRSESPKGKRKLMEWLLSPALAEEINSRQESVKELCGELDWRQDLQVSFPGVVIDEKVQDAVLLWTSGPPVKLPVVHRFMAIFLSVLALATLILWITGFLSIYFFLLSWIVNSIWLSFYQKKIATLQNVLNRFSGVARVYESMFTLVEKRGFSSVFLKQNRNKILTSGGTASKALRKFQNTLNWFDSRGNFFYWVFNSIFISDVWLYYSAQIWRARYGLYFGTWLDALAEIEAIGSLAAFSFANPLFSFPVVNENVDRFQAVDISHPLIFKSAISNDFAIDRQGSITLVTGSNMSGKSTFLRTIGTNMVLAFCGAPVKAAQMQLAPVWIFTCMRTQDDLSENISSFYAELLRLKQLLDMLKEDKSVFFLLDEILKGTNSHDRHQGARALINKLSQLNCSGLISTHDLELGVLEGELPGLRNFSFTSQVIDGKLYFDYRLKNGICRSFNAAHLMQMMGIM